MEADLGYSTVDLDMEEFRRSRFYLEWAKPNGFEDNSATCLMKTPTRFGSEKQGNQNAG